MQWRGLPFEKLPTGRGRLLREGDDVAVLAIGATCAFALDAAEKSATEGVSVAVYDLRYAKPLDGQMLDEVGNRYTRIITVEDGVLRGGVGELPRLLRAFRLDRGHFDNQPF